MWQNCLRVDNWVCKENIQGREGGSGRRRILEPLSNQEHVWLIDLVKNSMCIEEKAQRLLASTHCPCQQGHGEQRTAAGQTASCHCPCQQRLGDLETNAYQPEVIGLVSKGEGKTVGVFIAPHPILHGTGMTVEEP